MKKTLVFILTIAIILLPAALLGGCETTKDGTAFGTFYEFDYDADSNIKASTYSKNILENWETLENTGSTQIASSDIARINSAQAGEAVTVSELTVKCLKLAIEYNAIFPEFNPAIYPLVELWQFSPDTFIGAATSIPSQEQIEEALKYCSLSCFKLDESANTVTKTNSNAKLDFGAFLKGVAVDYAANELVDCEEYFVNLGGTIKANYSITVAVANPRGGDYRAKVTFSGLAVATSGDYERYYIYEGKRYHHILGRDGYPAGLSYSNPITSVTVVGEDATICDILSTAVFIKGTDADKLLTYLGYSALILTDISAQTIGADNATWTIL